MRGEIFITRKALITFLAFILCALQNTTLFADIITAPIDGRPVSLDYLKNLAQINGENFFAPDKDTLDIFPINENYSRFVKSDIVRKQIREQVSAANSENTTVIINTSSYMTGGLVGSRLGDNYGDFKEALNELENLTEEYDKPSYYVNLSMPRTLPETRMNTIWRDNKKYRGMGYYYIKNNPEIEDAKYISQKLSLVTPTQLIMEWSYVENKKSELGESSLTSWEKDFIKHFNSVYRAYEPYKTYLSKYVMPFSSVSEIFSRLMKMQEKGKIDEIIISNDDFQIPDFITYFNKKGADWIPKENGAPIKFSFARNYITKGPRCIYKLLKDSRGVYEASDALKGKSENVNFIFGTDEIPQLIYARDLSKRKNISSVFNVISTSESGSVGEFDVLKINSLVKNDINFISAGKKKTDGKIDLYIYDYSNKKISAESIIKEMEESKNKGKSVGLIEIFAPDVSASGKNTVFLTLLNNSKEKNGKLGINELACYSAWNTNANAIGLGVAHAQVFGITRENCADDKTFLKNHLNILAIHCAEDGFYTLKGKRALTNEKFVPVYEDTLKSEKLPPVIGSEEVISAFNGGKHAVKNKLYYADKFNLSEYNFPWGRLFECYLGFDCEIIEIS
ncbi:MAG: DUF4127 family protein [Clostridiales bacterium]|nr:DUF4127 family protein [Clostridiales bacterium]